MDLSKNFEISAGPELHYLESGSGSPLLLLPGWSQTAAMFYHQLDAFGGSHRVLALDHRGHGESGKIDHGYRVSTLAIDLRHFILGLNLDQITLLGHSMGAAVIFSYFEQFGSDRIKGIILDDQPAALTLDDETSNQVKKEAGVIFTLEQLTAICDALRGDGSMNATREMLAGMLSERLIAESMEWILTENLKLPRKHAATLLWDCAVADWRKVIPQIDVPTLVIGGKASVVPWESQQWNHEQIDRSECKILEAEQGGYHFAFLERPDRFNAIIGAFLATHRSSNGCG